MIKIGDNPEKTKGINKFIGQDGEGYRWKIIALHKSRKEAIILAMNTGTKIRWGKIYHITEDNPKEYPQVKSLVLRVPNSPDWEII